MLSDGEAERTDLPPKSVVFGMCVREQIGVLRSQSAVAVQKRVRDGDGDDFRQKHVMRAKRDGLDDFAFDIERTVSYERAFDLRGRQRRKSRLREFIDVATGFHAAPVCDFRLRGSWNIDDKFLCSCDDFMGIALLSNGDGQHGGIGADGSGPCDCDDVRSVGGFAAAAGDEHDWHWHQHGARLPYVLGKQLLKLEFRHIRLRFGLMFGIILVSGGLTEHFSRRAG